MTCLNEKDTVSIVPKRFRKIPKHEKETKGEEGAFQNWTKWLSVREKQQAALSSATSRPAQCLMMNSEDVWEMRREKWLIEEAARFREPDRYRGDPNFWRTPNYLKPGANNLLSMVHSALENYNRNAAVELKTKDNLGIPNKILEEKKLTDLKCLKTRIDLWNSSVFVKNRKIELKYAINAIDHVKPDITNLIVTGKSISKKEPEPIPVSIPEIIIDGSDETKGPIDSFCESPILKIGNLIFNPRNQCFSSGESDAIIYKVEFQDCYIDTKYRNEIRFENLGLVSIHYRWKKIKPYLNSQFPLTRVVNRLPTFFFNNGEGIIPPGQIIVLPFWFKSRTTGYYSEKWRLLTKPSITDSMQTIISLRALVLRNLVKPPRCKIEERLNKCVEHILESKRKKAEFLTRVQLENELPYVDTLTDEELFLSNNPDLYYNEEIVQNLKEMYKNNFNDEWNLSVLGLIRKLKCSDMINEQKKYWLKVIEDNWDMDVDDIKTAVVVPEYQHKIVYIILSTAVNHIQIAIDSLREQLKLEPIPGIEIPEGNEKKIKSSHSICKPLLARPVPENTHDLTSRDSKIILKERGAQKGVGIKSDAKSKLPVKPKCAKDEIINVRTEKKVEENLKPSKPARKVILDSYGPPLYNWYTSQVYKEVYKILIRAVDDISISLDSLKYCRQPNEKEYFKKLKTQKLI